MSSLFILTGPTASGKSSLAIDFCVEYNLKNPHTPYEIISADSLTVYEHFNIGSAKPTSDEQKGVKHHLLSVQHPNERYDAALFLQQTEAILDDLQRRNAKAMIVGGTGFYLKAFLFGMWDAIQRDEALRESLSKKTNEELILELSKKAPHWPFHFSKNDRYRIIRTIEVMNATGQLPILNENEDPKIIRENVKVLWIDRDDEELKNRIEMRTEKMLKEGLIEEVKKISEDFKDAPGLESVGYKEVLNYFKGITPPGRKPREGMLGLADEINLSTIQLVKKQRTFFKGQIEKHLGEKCLRFNLPVDEKNVFRVLLSQ